MTVKGTSLSRLVLNHDTVTSQKPKVNPIDTRKMSRIAVSAGYTQSRLVGPVPGRDHSDRNTLAGRTPANIIRMLQTLYWVNECLYRKPSGSSCEITRFKRLFRRS